MSFKYSAFHENTPEAREWLERGADYMGCYIRAIWNNILGYGCYNGGLI